MINATLLIVHGLLAVLLIGAMLHQTIAVWQRAPRIGWGILARVANVRGASYTNAIVALYVATTVLGAYIYPIYILNVKRGLADADLTAAIGSFEIKEHLAIVGLAMLPSYWLLWNQAAREIAGAARRMTTTLLAAIIVWNFMIGHVVNNLKGLT